MTSDHINRLSCNTYLNIGDFITTLFRQVSDVLWICWLSFVYKLYFYLFFWTNLFSIVFFNLAFLKLGVEKLQRSVAKLWHWVKIRIYIIKQDEMELFRIYFLIFSVARFHLGCEIFKTIFRVGIEKCLLVDKLKLLNCTMMVNLITSQKNYKTNTSSSPSRQQKSTI